MAEPEAAAPSFGRKARYHLRVHRYFYSVLVFVIGIALTVLAIGYFTPLKDSPPFSQINPITGGPPGPNDTPNPNATDYNLVFIIAGPITFIIGAYFVGSYYIHRRKFEHLMQTKSKAEFLRNLPEVEELLWDLTPNDEERYAAKKAELRIRR